MLVDGRGFVMKRRDEETAEVEVESTSTDHEVTGIHIALVREGGREGGREFSDQRDLYSSCNTEEKS